MITRVSMLSPNRVNSSPSVNSNPSFGMARLNSKAREAAESYGFTLHSYLDGRMFERPSFFATDSMLSQKLAEGADFVKLCELYGCSNDGARNAQFIENQVLNKKSVNALMKLPEEVYIKGMTTLYDRNYDNPSLSVYSTEELLERVNAFMSTDELVKNYGILRVGTRNYSE